MCVADRKIGYRLLGSALRLFGSRADRLFLSFLPRSRGGGAPVPHLPSARCLLRAPLFLVPPSLSSGRFLLPALFYPESALAFRPGWSRLVCPRIWSVHMHCSLSPFPLERVCVRATPDPPALKPALLRRKSARDRRWYSAPSAVHAPLPVRLSDSLACGSGVRVPVFTRFSYVL